MAKYDLPAMVNFILKKTGQPSLHYAGHSQGSLIAFAELSRNQDLAQKIKAVFALGPVAYLGHMESPLKFLADFIPELEVIQSCKNGDLLDRCLACGMRGQVFLQLLLAWVRNSRINQKNSWLSEYEIPKLLIETEWMLS